MNEPDVRRALLAAVPDLTGPPDRLAEVRRRAGRQRTARLTGAVVVAVLALVAVGGTMRLLAVSGPGTPGYGQAGTSPSVRPDPSGYPSAPPSGSGPSGSGLPSGSGAPPFSPSGPPSGNAGQSPPTVTGGPLVGHGYCPPTLVLMPPMGVDEIPYHTGSPQVRYVTLCRYRHPGGDTGQGSAALVTGPVRLDRAAVSAALVPILSPPPSPGNTEGCRFPSPQTGVIVEVVYAVDVDGRAAVYTLHRYVCQNPWADDPRLALERVVDRAVGAPY